MAASGLFQARFRVMGFGNNMVVKDVCGIAVCLFGAVLCGEVQAGSAFDCLIEPTQTVDISSSVSGLLDKVYVQRGDKVHKDQVVAALESTAEAAATELALYRSQLTAPTETAKSKIKFAKLKFQRRADMHAEDFMSAQDKDEAESDLRLAEAELKTAEENKEIARIEWKQQKGQLDLRSFRSPFEGVVVDQVLYPGEVVEAGGQKKTILKLAELDPLRVYVILPMSAFGKIKMGMKVDVRPEMPVGGHYVGSVIIIDRIVNAASGTFGVFLRVPNPKLDVPAGVKCKAEFPVGLEAHGPAAPKAPSHS